MRFGFSNVKSNIDSFEGTVIWNFYFSNETPCSMQQNALYDKVSEMSWTLLKIC